MKQSEKTQWPGRTGAILLGLVLWLVLTASAFAAPRRTVLVRNVREMMEALADNTEIILEPGRYDLSQWLEGEGAQRLIHRYAWNPDSPPGLYLSHELEIAGFRDLTIRGRGSGEEDPAEIVIRDPYCPVLKFRNCRNLRLSHLQMGHAVAKGYCSGAVLYMDEVQDMSLEKVDLYGCGTYGYEARHSRNITVRDSVIRECTYGLVSAVACKDLKFQRTVFKDTSSSLPLFAVSEARLDLQDCIFQNVCGKMRNLSVATGDVGR